MIRSKSGKGKGLGKRMKRSIYWYKVDNAGKIFPAVSKDSRSSVFRLSFYLKEEIVPKLLEQAVNETLPRFESFAVQLKAGMFWYYLAANTRSVRIEKESPIICRFFHWTKNNGYLFKVYYFKNKITLETFHSLSDGTGAMEFLKAITQNYLKLCGHEFSYSGKVKSELPSSPRETVDMFVSQYDKSSKMNLKEEIAYHVKGEKFADYFTLCINAKVPTEQLLAHTRRLGVTVGVYITAVLAYSIYTQRPDCRTTKCPIKIFIPTNLRKFFPSDTLRNFSLYIKATFDGRKEWTFEQMLAETKRQFDAQLVKEELHARMNSNVWIEKNLVIRLLPLFLKNIAFKIGYKRLADDISTCYISNLGKVTLPSDMNDFVEDVEFAIGGFGIAVTSIHGHTNIMLNTDFKDISILQYFINHFIQDGLLVTVDTNYLEA